MKTVDHAALAADFMRALRGRRSQRSLSKRLGYRTNIAYRWESQRCAPSALSAFLALDKLNHRPCEKLAGFVSGTPSGLREHKRPSAEWIRLLLAELRGSATLTSLARSSGFSRFQLSRWLSGVSEPGLLEFLKLIDVMSLRLLEMISLFFDPAKLPSIAALARQHDALREAAYDVPWSHGILRALELSAYAGLRRHRPGWLAKRLHISLEEEVRALKLLSAAGQVRWTGRRYEVMRVSAVDTRQEPRRSRTLRGFWLEQARTRLLSEQPGYYGFSLFSVSERDFQRLRELHLRYYHDVQALVAASEPCERVGLLSMQLLPLDDGPWPGAA